MKSMKTFWKIFSLFSFVFFFLFYLLFNIIFLYDFHVFGLAVSRACVNIILGGMYFVRITLEHVCRKVTVRRMCGAAVSATYWNQKIIMPSYSIVGQEIKQNNTIKMKYFFIRYCTYLRYFFQKNNQNLLVYPFSVPV